ncbi:hypothetical protein CRG98_008261 [Punica granatum]|uniref:Uncharacterized protein n=1 Tax=Punica granatum TaxID=22663 RepID=A0A2I0KSA5_PUNGR|nr:hypothetical protein CRG98_008261 [Punica granatum]
MQKSNLARVSRHGKVARGTGEQARQTCGAGKKVTSRRLADPASLQEARERCLGEFAVQESILAQAWQGFKWHERGGSANLRCKNVNSHGLAVPARLEEARARWFGELAVPESCKRHGRAGSANLRCRKVGSHGLADPARLQEARASRLGKLAVQESRLARVSRPGKVARGTGEQARQTCGAGKKVGSHGLADPARLQEARASRLGKLAVQESRLARVSRPGKVARGTGEQARQTCGAGKKVGSHGLADPARLQEARASRLGKLAVQESRLARVSRPGKVARGTGEQARQTCGAGKKVGSHGLADPARLQEARASRLGKLAVQESRLARVSRPGKVARGTGEQARQTCGAGKKVGSHGLADPARLQEARASRLGKLAVQESRLARVSRPGKVARGTGEQARQTCGAGKKVGSHGLADPARLQEARASRLGKLAVQESRLARVSRPGKVARGTGEQARQTCGAGKKVGSHGLADPARLQEARASRLGKLAVQESRLARVSRPGKVARGTGEQARQTCGAGKKVGSHGLADPARLQEARASRLGKLAVQESRLARVSRPGKVARGTGEQARQTCGAGKKVGSHGLADPARLQEARASRLGKLAVQESRLARVSRPGKVARGTGEQARQTCGAGKKVGSHGLADPARLQEARASRLGKLAVQESRLARVSRPGKVARGTSEVARRTCGAVK